VWWIPLWKELDLDSLLIRSVVGLVVNIVAIVVYLELARSGRRGFRRLLAFWIGFPMTFFVKLFVRPDPDLVVERRLNALLPPEEEDVGVPEYVRKEIRAIREDRLRASQDSLDRDGEGARQVPGPGESETRE